MLNFPLFWFGVVHQPALMASTYHVYYFPGHKFIIVHCYIHVYGFNNYEYTPNSYGFNAVDFLSSCKFILNIVQAKCKFMYLYREIYLAV